MGDEIPRPDTPHMRAVAGYDQVRDVRDRYLDGLRRVRVLTGSVEAIDVAHDDRFAAKQEAVDGALRLVLKTRVLRASLQ